ncbi:MAG TPA: asparagine synthase (glutamine-hydrolyzing) [Candidatus Krumholzibacteria bacterium]|nr:asparagine synthase (glutamine-hydrolyzing) [Candidatus Krumholzibacteria bacterium]HPD72623.1 asparagine synthase (glutamine-hydrolyzing) [Candidatus Krumholzibacteria bacterium]HRY40445.1 asparagine synthase (glutamine-hydrolyzing) [Candidatus Krumholzibacteria bacterium]
MCGICGAIALEGPLQLPDRLPERMIGSLRHRGPDEFAAWRDESCFLGHSRLSIVDLVTGQQPLTGEDGRHWIVFNGEIFNYPELTAELEARGHAFRTRSDTEVIVHAYEEWGETCVERFNGQFAFAIWDRAARSLFLARDRFGILPLYVARAGRVLLFASEAKALFAWPGLDRRLAPDRLAEVFTYWACIAPATPFAGVAQLPPGTSAVCASGEAVASPPPAPLPACLRVRRYWRPEFLPAREDAQHPDPVARRRMAREIREGLEAAAVIRLRADVPVGAYLSGGLDSSATTALIQSCTRNRLRTFSVGFRDRAYDESQWQRAMVAHLGTEHSSLEVGPADIAGRFAEVVWHTESPVLRTAPAPLFALSGLVRRHGWKVVLTGEGADEVFCGYNIFREAKVRRFWARQPRSPRRPLLLTRLYPYLEQSPPQFLARFYGQGLDQPEDPLFSHRPRWQNTGMMTTFLVPDALAPLAAGQPEARLLADLPREFAGWGPVARAQYLEMTTFLAGYLLSSQGDRMLMGNSVEGRFPFLDHELARIALATPAAARLPALKEKDLLKEAVGDLLPAAILQRPKQPYRAPDAASFQDRPGRAIAEAALAPEAVAAAGFWLPERVASLARKWETGRLTSARENMAFIGVLSTQLLAQAFGATFPARLEQSTLAPGELVWRSSHVDQPERTC